MGCMPKYKRMACFTHSFTCHPLAVGSATLSLPLSTSSITALIASCVSAFETNSRFCHACSIDSLNFIAKIFAKLAELNQLKRDENRVRCKTGFSQYHRAWELQQDP